MGMFIVWHISIYAATIKGPILSSHHTNALMLLTKILNGACGDTNNDNINSARNRSTNTTNMICFMLGGHHFSSPNALCGERVRLIAFETYYGTSV